MTRTPTHAQYDEALRQGILEEATRRLRDAVPEKLGLRPLAASQGTSTTAIYTMFGGKSGLLAAVAVEADRSLAATLRGALRHDSLETDMRSLCRAYRRWALENEGLYALVVGEPTRSPRTGPGSGDPRWREPLLGPCRCAAGTSTERVARVAERRAVLRDPARGGTAVLGGRRTHRGFLDRDGGLIR